MKISYNWLKEHLNFDLNPTEAGDLLTSTGLEVEGIEKVESVKGGLEGLVIGEVLTCEKHPDADKLKITTVAVGKEIEYNIVCGAPNVAIGQKVVVALPGTTIHPLEGEPFTIKKAKIRGVESNGMICAEDEIGLGSSHDGIIILPNETIIGQLAKEYFKIKSDFVFEIGLTPNRIDAASHRGVARDLKAVLLQRKGINLELISQLPEIVSENNSKEIQVDIQNTEACKRYSSVTISNIKVAESPDWLKEKLNAIGLRPINNVVDITNFVLHDLGQPLHAFDADKISGGKIIVRNAKPNSTFITLDEVERKLDGSELMICDEKNELCIAGIFGGLTSGVTEKTTSVFLESAWFDPTTIRKTAKKFGLSTDASFRFERGVDPKMTLVALHKATHLIKEIAGGTISSSISDNYPNEINEIEISLNIEQVNSLIGKDISIAEVKNILTSLDFEIIQEKDNQLKIKIPSYRVDVTREPDVIEEILRIYGYNEIGLPDKMSSSISFSQKVNAFEVVENISNFLSANGFHEIMTNSLTSSSQVDVLKLPHDHVKVLNPLSSELDIMRGSLILNGLHSIAYNLNRQQHDLKFFEFGKIYFKSAEKYIEQNFISLLLTGKKENENWNASKENSDIYSIISFVDALFKKTGIFSRLEKKENKHSLFIDCVEYVQGKKVIASVGPISKNALKYADIKQPVFAAEINFDLLIDLIRKVKIQFEDLPKFPSVRRDLSLLLDSKVHFNDIEKIARNADKKLIKEVGLFDVYEGKNLEAGKKSYAISFILYNEESTLTDKEVDGVMNKIIDSLSSELGAKLR